MLPRRIGWLCIILPFLTAATPQTTLSDGIQSPLPGKLQKDVPACAQPCLQKSLAEQFPLSCTVPTSLNCLCSTYSIGGQSLGEVALGCIYTSCSSVDHTAVEAYNVCLGISNAVKPTFSTLTVPLKTSTASTAMTSSTPVTTTGPLVTSNTTPLPSSPTESVVVDSISSTPSPTVSSSPMTSSPSAAVDRPQTMKPAHIAGLAVAAVATFIIAIGLIVLSIFLRRRRERRRKSEAVNEKLGLPHSPTDDPNRLTQSVGRSESTLDLSARFPLPPVPALRRPGEGTSSTMARHPRPLSPPGQNDRPAVPPKNETNNTPANDLGAIHPVLRPTLNAANKSSDSSLTVNQIGLAISSEVPRQSTVMGNSIPPARRLSFRQQRQRSIRRISEASQRPDSDVTQYTVFEEDDTVDAPEQRRQSVLLPTPPIPIPPIRSFQPSRPPPRFPMQPPTQSQQPRQRSELFIDIPIRQSSTRPPRFIPQDPSQGATSTLRASLAPPIELLPPQKPMTTNTSTPETHHSGDIPDYYFTSHRYRTPKNSTPRIDNPPHRKPPAEKPHVKPKSSSSNVSRTTSRASTNIRDSFSSQTSFESADMDDPTPEDENNNKLSPVAESPISNLRYPKVPRTSNQLVPRSPRSPQSQKSQDSPRWLPGPSSLLIKRRGEEPARQIGSPLSGSPLPNEMRQQIRQYRQHLRSNSVETWSPIRDSERSTRTQSGMWPPKSPMMYEPDVVRPLSIRPKQNQKFLQTPRTEREVLKSPVWVPRLTPTRQGEDLFINVTYSKPGQ